MFYVFVQSSDLSGDGIRAKLDEFDDHVVAEQAFVDACLTEETISVKFISGTIIRKYDQVSEDAPAPISRELSNEDLQASALEDVDNLEDKENV